MIRQMFIKQLLNRRIVPDVIVYTLLHWYTCLSVSVTEIEWLAKKDKNILVQCVRCILCDRGVLKNLNFEQQMYGVLMILPPSCFVYFWNPIYSQNLNASAAARFLISKFEKAVLGSEIISYLAGLFLPVSACANEAKCKQCRQEIYRL